ncbi:trafficking protein particle complex subunit 4-like [Sciurus carolinensis]|uniref:trafficking protein particle complex subunit 4-like n=1 Tax=Sciurus carolinensis TaxID=30640 RepID=UPI001FB1F3B0|nr:trafficking protein particle complex subunit 4-like [Sciurus carolinensis]
MSIFSVYVVNEAGGLIYQLDSYAPRAEAEKRFSYPLDLLLKLRAECVLGAFGQCDGIRVGHAVLAINGVDVNCKYMADGKEVLEYQSNPANYPESFRFGRPRRTSSEKLMLASIGSQLSPEQGSSGTEILETDTCKRHCFQTLTEMPIGCELFDQNLKLALEVAEKAGIFGPGSYVKPTMDPPKF